MKGEITVMKSAARKKWGFFFFPRRFTNTALGDYPLLIYVTETSFYGFPSPLRLTCFQVGN